jgi:DUF1680 family protein
MEGVDNPAGFDGSIAPQSFAVTRNPELLGGVNVITEKSSEKEYVLIPYYTWSNRGAGKMKVFFEK